MGWGGGLPSSARDCGNGQCGLWVAQQVRPTVQRHHSPAATLPLQFCGASPGPCPPRQKVGKEMLPVFPGVVARDCEVILDTCRALSFLTDGCIVGMAAGRTGGSNPGWTSSGPACNSIAWPPTLHAGVSLQPQVATGAGLASVQCVLYPEGSAWAPSIVAGEPCRHTQRLMTCHVPPPASWLC